MEQMFDILVLVDEAQRQEQEKAAARQRLIDGQVDELRQAVDRVLQRVANDHTAGEFEIDWPKDTVSAGWREVTVAGLLPFYVVARFGVGVQPPVVVTLTDHAPTDRSHYPARTLEAAVDDMPTVIRLMKQQRDGWLHRQAEREKQAARLVAQEMGELQLRFQDPYRLFPTEAEALAALERLKAYYGAERAEALTTLMGQWQAIQDQRAREKAAKAEQARQQEAERKLYQQQLADYQALFAAYWAEVEQIQTANAARVEALQARWNEPYQISELTYALVAVDDEAGKRYVDTKTITCLYPPKNGFHRRLQYGQIKLMQLQHPVSWTPPQMVYPAEAGSHAPGIDIGGLTGVYEQEIYYHPLADREAVARDIAETLAAVPVEPAPPDNIDHDDIRTAEGRVMRNDPEYIYRRNNW